MLIPIIINRRDVGGGNNVERRLAVEVHVGDGVMMVAGGAAAWSKLHRGSVDIVHDGQIPKVGKFAINKARDEERKRDAALDRAKTEAGFQK